jgi:biopolymer transport protein ExbD
MNLRSRNKVDASFNMSSLSDVIFLLLIFFMLTSTLVTPSAIKLLLPNGKSQVNATQTVEVSVTHEQKYYVNDVEVPYNQLKNKISAALAEYRDKMPEPTVKLRVDKRASVEDLVSVMKFGEELKVKMILATEKK